MAGLRFIPALLNCDLRGFTVACLTSPFLWNEEMQGQVNIYSRALHLPAARQVWSFLLCRLFHVFLRNHQYWNVGILS
jgi:hypothetical protein